jgi:hypothetical protein
MQARYCYNQMVAIHSVGGSGQGQARLLLLSTPGQLNLNAPPPPCDTQVAAIQDRNATGSQEAPAQLLGNCEEVADMLCLASHYNDLPWLNMLLKAGADANGCDYDQRTPLHIAAADGHLKAVRVLVEKGSARVDVRDRWGNSPLSEAQKINASNVVEYLESAAIGKAGGS